MSSLNAHLRVPLSPFAGTSIEALGGVGGDDGDVDTLEYLGSYGDDIGKSYARALTNKRAGQ